VRVKMPSPFFIRRHENMAYVTKQDYLNFAGVDLDLELKKSNYDNPSRAVEIFINKIERSCEEYLYSTYFVDNFDSAAFKQAVLYQIEYTLMHGDISVNNPQKLPFLSPGAFRVLQRAGMCNITPVKTYSNPVI
jgi:hypothetical protein